MISERARAHQKRRQKEQTPKKQKKLFLR
jgi:hypothetical protein